MIDEGRLDKIKGLKPTEATACCKFCKQLINICIQDYRTEEDKEELATELCRCPEAVNYTRMKKNNERVGESIEDLVGEGELSEHIETIVKDVMNGGI